MYSMVLSLICERFSWSEGTGIHTNNELFHSAKNW